MARVTINMIAEKAGVSRGTVDRVLHNRADVAPDVRERILAVAKIMGYIDTPEKSGEIRLIGAILPGNSWFDSYLRKEWLRGLEDARGIVEPLGYNVKLIECDTDLPGDIIDAAETLKKEGASGIIMTAMETPAVKKCIDYLADSGIPVVTYNSDIADCRRACFIGQDVYKSGRAAANMMRGCIGKDDRILAVAGNLAFAGHAERIRGFIDVCTGMGIRKEQIVVKESHNEYLLTASIVSDALKSIDNLKAVYMANESIAACADILRAEADGRKIMVVGNDLTGATRKLLLEGIVDFIIEQNIYWQGYQPVLTVKKLIEMPDYPIEKTSFTSIGVVNAESIRQL